MGCPELQIHDYFTLHSSESDVGFCFSGDEKTPDSGFRFVDETAYEADLACERKNAYTGIFCHSVICLNDPINRLDLLGLLTHEEAMEYLRKKAKDIYVASKCDPARFKAIISTMYPELRRQSTKDRWVDSTAEYMYIKRSFKDNSYGPAQIKPSFAEAIIPPDKDDIESRKKVYDEIMNNPERIISKAFDKITQQWNDARKINPNVADISSNVGALATIYNLGLKKSIPKSNPQLGGSNIKLDGETKPFGQWAEEFSNSEDAKKLMESVGIK